MTYAGARSHTEQQMARALRDDLGQSRVHLAASQLDTDVRDAATSSAQREDNASWVARFKRFVRTFARTGTSPPEVELSTAHSVWVGRHVRLLPAFSDTLRARYAAQPRLIDFAQGDKARSTINGWVSEHTHGRIRDLVPPGALSPQTRLVLCDAIYFRGAWEDSFHCDQTANGPFHLDSRSSITVPLMRSHGMFLRYAENRSLQVLELPYRRKNFAMLLILPRALDGLAAIERQLEPESLAAWDSRMEEVLVSQLVVPRFKIESQFRLADPLCAMGMRDAFTENADFSGMTPDRPLFVSDVYHKAYVAVDEHGTEAAAATAVPMLGGAPMSATFTADHPFLFLIRHQASGSILFMGRLADPR